MYWSKGIGVLLMLYFVKEAPSCKAWNKIKKIIGSSSNCNISHTNIVNVKGPCSSSLGSEDSSGGSGFLNEHDSDEGNNKIFNSDGLVAGSVGAGLNFLQEQNSGATAIHHGEIHSSAGGSSLGKLSVHRVESIFTHHNGIHNIGYKGVSGGISAGGSVGYSIHHEHEQHGTAALSSSGGLDIHRVEGTNIGMQGSGNGGSINLGGVNGFGIHHNHEQHGTAEHSSSGGLDIHRVEGHNFGMQYNGQGGGSNTGGLNGYSIHNKHEQLGTVEQSSSSGLGMYQVEGQNIGTHFHEQEGNSGSGYSIQNKHEQLGTVEKISSGELGIHRIQGNNIGIQGNGNGGGINTGGLNGYGIHKEHTQHGTVEQSSSGGLGMYQTEGHNIGMKYNGQGGGSNTGGLNGYNIHIKHEHQGITAQSSSSGIHRIEGHNIEMHYNELGGGINGGGLSGHNNHHKPGHQGKVEQSSSGGLGMYQVGHGHGVGINGGGYSSYNRHELGKVEQSSSGGLGIHHIEVNDVGIQGNGNGEGLNTGGSSGFGIHKEYQQHGTAEQSSSGGFGSHHTEGHNIGIHNTGHGAGSNTGGYIHNDHGTTEQSSSNGLGIHHIEGNTIGMQVGGTNTGAVGGYTIHHREETLNSADGFDFHHKQETFSHHNEIHNNRSSSQNSTGGVSFDQSQSIGAHNVGFGTDKNHQFGFGNDKNHQFGFGGISHDGASQTGSSNEGLQLALTIKFECSILTCICPMKTSLPPSVTCKPGTCSRNEECFKHLACVDGRCEDLCRGGCGEKAFCEMKNHIPVCTCHPGYSGDPNKKCVPGTVGAIGTLGSGGTGLAVSVHVPCVSGQCICSIGSTENCVQGICRKDEECEKDLACVNGECINLCPNACGYKAACDMKNHRAVCVCLPGHVGNPDVECTPADVCSPNPCGANAVCKNLAQKPICLCMPGYMGDPITGCKHECEHDSECTIKQSCVDHKCRDACSLCGKYAICASVNLHKPTCKCPENYFGNPEVACRPECTVHSDCPRSKPNCRFNKCRNPCDGACGAMANCRIVGSEADCTCPDNLTGNPLILCRPFEKKDFCEPFPCGQNSKCDLGFDHQGKYRAVCNCLSGFYSHGTGDCFPGECSDDDHCPDHKACVDFTCQDPCLNQCGTNSICEASNHTAVCDCMSGFEGNPLSGCTKTITIQFMAQKSN